MSFKQKPIRKEHVSPETKDEVALLRGLRVALFQGSDPTEDGKTVDLTSEHNKVPQLPEHLRPGDTLVHSGWVPVSDSIHAARLSGTSGYLVRLRRRGETTIIFHQTLPLSLAERIFGRGSPG
jgi:hypothetical protein